MVGQKLTNDVPWMIFLFNMWTYVGLLEARTGFDAALSSGNYLRFTCNTMQEAVAVTTKLQEEIFLEMGVGKSVLLDIVGESVSRPSVYQRRLKGQSMWISFICSLICMPFQ